MANEQKNSNKAEAHFKIYLTDLIKGVKKLWWVCIALAVLFGGGFALHGGLNYTPKYQTSATFIVSMQSVSGASTGLSKYSYSYDTSTAEQLATTFPHILSSNLLQEMVCTELGENGMPATVSADVVKGTNMFKLSTFGKDPQKTYDTLISVINNYPSVAKHVIGNIKMDMITSPVFPQNPYNSPEYKDNFVTGATLGLIAGCVLIFLYAVFRNTIRTKDEIKTELNSNILGAVPKVVLKKRREKDSYPILVSDSKIPSTFSEAIRVCRNVFVNSLKEEEKVVLVTSTAPGEGKTTIITNIALSLAKRNKKVLLVDGDLRNPSIAPLLDINMDEVEYQTISDKYEIAFLESYNLSVLRFIFPDQEKESFVSTAFAKDVFDNLRDQFDYILVDTPPCGLVSDAMFIAQAADAAIYVIYQDVVGVSKIKSSLNNLLSTDVKIAGCVLNGAIGASTGYGYGYGYGYKKYGYGYNYGKKYGYGAKSSEFEGFDVADEE